jgi:hypothetical protein
VYPLTNLLQVCTLLIPSKYPFRVFTPSDHQKCPKKDPKVVHLCNT